MTDNNQAIDIFQAYEFILTREQTLPSDLADKFGHNMRYSREILGALIGAKLINLDTSTDMDFYVAKPTDDAGKAFAKAFKVDLPTAKPTKPAKKSTPAKPASKDYHPCGCGCGENVPPKSNYRPGHDARHAGQVGREIAANYSTPGFDRRELLKALPSDALKAKAEKVAETAIAKIDAKNAKAKAKTEVEGIVTVGKTEYAAVKSGDTVIRVDTGKPVSATAAKTFVAG